MVKRSFLKPFVLFHLHKDTQSGVTYCFLFRKCNSSMSRLLELLGMSAKPVVAGIAACFVLFSSSWVPLYFITASLCNALLSKLLKNVMQVPRPPTAEEGQIQARAEAQLLQLPQSQRGSKTLTKIKAARRLTYGMPSSHAQTLAFFLLVCVRLLLQAPTAPTTANAGNSYSFRIQDVMLYLELPLQSASAQDLAVIGLLIAYAFCAASWRVHTGLHTLAQTAVGACVGGVAGSLAHYFSASVLASASASAFAGVVIVNTAAPVPAALKAAVCAFGAGVLYFQEMRALSALHSEEGATQALAVATSVAKTK